MFSTVPALTIAMAFWAVAIPCSAQEAASVLQPYSGPVRQEVDTSTLHGKVLAGYQGWFTCEGDGANLGWTHWARKSQQPLGPDNATIDLLPDMAEYGPTERFVSLFHARDGKAIEVFSSHHRDTVLRHFAWMREYGIDGALVQRFANGLASGPHRSHKDVVLSHCREGANREGRAYAIMYDLSGLQAGQVQRIVDDWLLLKREFHIGEDAAYLRHRGKPLVAIWGVGFNDNRAYTLQECHLAIEQLRAAGCSIMLGIPTGWRQQDRDAISEKSLHETLALADVLSPWTVGRYRNPNEVANHANQTWQPDIQWTQQHGMDYMPVVYPGFSWQHLKHRAKLDEIPRLQGRFLWSQFVEAKKAGASMIYVAMFDEVDEGTAIFKCRQESPTEEPFLTYEDVPSDHYLWLTGQGKRWLIGERNEQMPSR